MEHFLSIISNIGEMDTAYIIIAFIAIAVLWIVTKMMNKKKE